MKKNNHSVAVVVDKLSLFPNTIREASIEEAINLDDVEMEDICANICEWK